MHFDLFWRKEAKKLDWEKFPKKILSRKNKRFIWFEDGRIDIYKNLIKPNLKNNYGIYFINADKKILYKSIDDINQNVENYCRNFYCIKNKDNIKKVMLHCSSSIESCLSMLSFAKLGIHFSVIFEELSIEAIEKRIKIFKPDLVISKNINYINKLKKNRYYKKISFFSFKKFLKKNKKNIIIKSKVVKSNDSFFTLFTSGTTGEPKGVTHSYGGYLLYSKITSNKQFGLKKGSIMFAASDAGWINGHTYALFGPLSLKCSSVLIEKPTLILDENFLIKIINLKINVMYLPVTLIRMMKSFFNSKAIKSKYLKTLGSMGEPLAPEIGKWFSKKFNLSNKSIINTYFQTETGGIICSPNYKNLSKNVVHGSVGKTLFKKIQITNVKKIKKELKIITPWPGCMKDIINGKKFWDIYWDKNGYFKLFDEGFVKKNNLFVTGRTDDTINIRGHRIGSGEVEAILLQNKFISEASAIAVEDELEGKNLAIFIVCEKNVNDQIKKNLISIFGTFALPRHIIYTKELPKTRSGKIMRRLLRDIIENPNKINKTDISTLLNPNIINYLKNEIKKQSL